MTFQPDRRLNPWHPGTPSHAAAMPSRREILRAGGLSLAGLTLPKLLAAEENHGASGITPKADACIVLFLNGGPSHLDMWDMKPDAPDGIRGEFNSLACTARKLGSEWAEVSCQFAGNARPGRSSGAAG